MEETDGEPTRGEFADTAYFDKVSTGKNGIAKISFKLPDNVTSYRITAQSANEDLYVGSIKKNIISTLNLFVQSTMPRGLKDTDDVVLNATGVTKEIQDIEYEFTIKELNKTINTKGKSNTYVTSNFGKLDVGTYHAIIKAKNGEFEDSIEYEFTVNKAFQEVKTKTTTSINKKATIKPTKNPIVLEIYNKEMEKYIKYMDFIESTQNERLDTQLAFNVVQNLKEKYYGNSQNSLQIPINEYLREGYLRNLKNGSADFVLTALAKYYFKDYYNGYSFDLDTAKRIYNNPEEESFFQENAVEEGESNDSDEFINSDDNNYNNSEEFISSDDNNYNNNDSQNVVAEENNISTSENSIKDQYSIDGINLFEYYLIKSAENKPVLNDLLYLKEEKELGNYNKLLVTLSLEFLGDFKNAKDLYGKIKLNKEEEKKYESIIAIIETFINKKDASTKIDEIIEENPADEYVRFAILSFFENNAIELETKETAKLTAKNIEETFEINPMQIKTYTINDEDLSQINFETNSNNLMVSYYYQTSLEDIENENIIKDITLKSKGEFKKSNTIQLLISFGENYNYEGEVRIALPNSLRLAKNYNSYDEQSKYYVQSNNIDNVTIYKMKNCKSIVLPLLITNEGNYKFESIVCKTEDKYHISDPFEINIE